MTLSCSNTGAAVLLYVNANLPQYTSPNAHCMDATIVQAHCVLQVLLNNDLFLYAAAGWALRCEVTARRSGLV